jgi:Uroporphyrinogen-III methylase
VTGHLKEGELELDWQMLARPRQTVVIYMGAKLYRRSRGN